MNQRRKPNPNYENATHCIVLRGKYGEVLQVKGNEALYMAVTGRPHEPRFNLTKGRELKEVFPDEA